MGVGLANDDRVRGTGGNADGWQPYRQAAADVYTHERVVAPRTQASELLPGVHRIVSLAQRWLLGTHQGAVDKTHLQAYLDEFVRHGALSDRVGCKTPPPGCRSSPAKLRAA